MKRAAPVLLAILLGAVVTAIGMGVILKLANDDREHLGKQIEQARADAQQALADKERIANEANKKVEAANDEVEKAQDVLRALEDQQRLLADAKQLMKPASRDTRGWQSVVSLPLGVSLLIPSRNVIQTNDVRSITIGKQIATSTFIGGGMPDVRWLSVTRYNEQDAIELDTSIATSTPRSYLVNGRLLTGFTGVVEGNGPIAVFQVHQAASTTHLIWIKDPGTLGSGNGIERLLSTFEFAP
jgi:hypothetical protein